jgi:hypothetical protein
MEYIRLRAVCKPWRSSTANRPTWEPCFFHRNWVMIHKDEDDNDEAPADTAAPRRRCIVNMHIGSTLKSTVISLPTPRGSCFSTVCAPKRCTSSSPVTTAMAVLLVFYVTLGLEGARAHYYREHHRQEECAKWRSNYCSQRGAHRGLVTLAVHA